MFGKITGEIELVILQAGLQDNGKSACPIQKSSGLNRPYTLKAELEFLMVFARCNLSVTFMPLKTLPNPT
jgi:hypothetical protein